LHFNITRRYTVKNGEIMIRILKILILIVISTIFLQNCSSSKEILSDFANHKNEFLERLRAFPDYEYEDSSDYPRFKYSEATDSNLVEIRKTYELDKIAGDGDEITRMINLMKWVHSTIRHDGATKNPSPKNTKNIIKVCKTEDRAVNCRMLAIVLNEVYLSMGFKSRFITCEPMEKNFNDCHVINAVYSNELKKWIYMDPTFSVYMKNEEGEYLGIQEVRDYFINNKKVIVNEEINWNGEPYSKEKYLSYMAKNLFRLESPLKSAYNYESESGREYFELVPKNYSVFTLKRMLSEMFTSVDYNTTSNPDYFWER